MPQKAAFFYRGGEKCGLVNNLLPYPNLCSIRIRREHIEVGKCSGRATLLNPPRDPWQRLFSVYPGERDA